MVRFALAGGRVSPAKAARQPLRGRGEQSRLQHCSCAEETRRESRPSDRSIAAARLLAALIALAIALVVAVQASAAPTVWVAPSYLRVKQDASADTPAEISVCAARGEWESFQVVVVGSATNVRLTPPASAPVTVKLYREHYVPVTHGSSTYGSQLNKPEGPGIYPDALIPFDAPGGAISKAQPYSVPAGKVQPYWVDLFVPVDCAPGEYLLPFTVTSDQGSATVTARLTVWAFQLPQKPALQTAFAYWPPVRGQLQPELLLLENRIQPTFVEKSHSAALSAAGQSAVHVGFWASLDKSNCTIAKAKPTTADVDAAIANYAPLAAYAYIADEVYTDCDSSTPLYNWTEALRGRVKTMVTIAPRTGWEWLDIFVTLPKFDVAADVADAQARGSEVWSYNCLSQDGYSPKWLLDYAPINYRIQPGFLNWRRGLTGLLYWRVDYWSGGTGDPWTSGEVYSSSSYPGEGLLVYPGANIGLASNMVAPSMRLKYLRDGVDDYDYLALLVAGGQGDWAQELVTSIATDWRTWTRDSAQLEAVRRQLGERLNSLFAPHDLSLTAAVSPATVASGGSAALSATGSDSLGHAIATWSWSDGGAAGSFSPSASAQNPTYTAATNVTGANRTVTLTVTATCEGPTPIARSASTTLTVQSVAHALSVTASASPTQVASGGVASLSASAADSLGHTIAAWSWSDGGAGGSFSPSPFAQNPSYTAPTNAGDSIRQVALSVVATCAGWPAVSASASTTLNVEPVAHTLSVLASASPAIIPSAGSATLSASAVDSRGHAIIGWQWGDGGAGGSFAPSPSVANCIYTAAQNLTGANRLVTLTVSATCNGPTPIGASASTSVTVQPAAHELSVTASASPETVASGGATSLTASATDTFGHQVASWSWSDGEAGGTFSPSASAQSPVYTAAQNASGADRLVALTVTAVCDGPPPFSDSATVYLTVKSTALELPVEAGVPVPSVVPSESTTELSATTNDSARDETASWRWDDNGADGAFLPSETVRNPQYRAPRNGAGEDMRVVLTVTASCSDPAPMTGSDSTELIVEPAPHELTVSAYADPSVITWKGRAQLYATADDTLGHGIAQWAWSDNGAKGSFSPSASVRNPSYRARANDGAVPTTIVLSVCATCDGQSPLTASSYLGLIVQPKPNLRLRDTATEQDELTDSVLVIPSDPGEGDTFSDLPADFWATNAIQACVRAGIATGFPDGTYRPGLVVSRDQAAVYLARAVAGGDELVPAGPVDPSFTDVSASHWAYRYVEYAKTLQIVTGYPDGQYRPADDVTRAEMAAFIARSVVLPTGDDGLSWYQAPGQPSFSDVPVDHWAYRYVEFVARQGIAGGYEDGTYRPASPCTRAEAAVYLARAFNLIPS